MRYKVFFVPLLWRYSRLGYGGHIHEPHELPTLFFNEEESDKINECSEAEQERSHAVIQFSSDHSFRGRSKIDKIFKKTED